MKEYDFLNLAHLQASKHDRKSDSALWLSALWCARVVSRNTPGERGKTLALANDLSRSPDTVEDRAHGYWMFEKLCKLDSGVHRKFVLWARRAPFIHFSHFRALYDVQSEFGLSDSQILSLLMDIVQAEGDLSSRSVSDHARTRFGDKRDWTWYAQRAQKGIHATLQQPDTPKDIRDVLTEAYNKLGDKA